MEFNWKNYHKVQKLLDEVIPETSGKAKKNAKKDARREKAQLSQRDWGTGGEPLPPGVLAEATQEGLARGEEANTSPYGRILKAWWNRQ